MKATKVTSNIMRKKPVSRFLFVIFLGTCFSLPSLASSLSLTTAIQQENFVSDSNQDVSRTAIGAVGAEFEMNVDHHWSAGIFGGAQTSIISQENLSFGVGGFINYYFKGSPIKSEFKNSSSYISGLSRTSFFGGLGVEQRFLNSENVKSESAGGPFLRVGGRYIWNSNLFLSANLKFLLAGSDYSSVDMVFGLGFYL